MTQSMTSCTIGCLITWSERHLISLKLCQSNMLSLARPQCDICQELESPLCKPSMHRYTRPILLATVSVRSLWLLPDRVLKSVSQASNHALQKTKMHRNDKINMGISCISLPRLSRTEKSLLSIVTDGVFNSSDNMFGFLHGNAVWHRLLPGFTMLSQVNTWELLMLISDWQTSIITANLQNDGIRWRL